VMTIRDEVTRTVVETTTEEDRESLPQGLGRRLLSVVAGSILFLLVSRVSVFIFIFG